MREILSTRVAPRVLNSLGLEDIRIALWVDGEEVDHFIGNTGCPGHQTFRTLHDQVSGEKEPCPEGIFTPGPVEWCGRVGDTKTLWPEIASPIWIDIYPPRAIGGHLDGNRYDSAGNPYAPGSAGCEVCPDMKTLLQLASWWDAGKIERWTNDWGLNTVKRPAAVPGVWSKMYLNEKRTSAYQGGKPATVDLDVRTLRKADGSMHVWVNGVEVPARSVKVEIEQIKK